MDCQTCAFAPKCECKCKDATETVETKSEWIAEYKCRLCGETVGEDGKQSSITHVHHCSDGSYCAADFQGMRKREA